MAPRFQRVKEIFLAALEKWDPAERAAFLEEAYGGDEALRLQVEALLQMHEQAGSVLQTSLVDPGATIDSEDGPKSQNRGKATRGKLAEANGNWIGPYKLLQKLGEGGMGSVWVAEQQEPVKRRVALKVIKPGLDSAQILRRFEAERQTLALMDHASIARVLDAGTTDLGRPYFVMELVQGVPITRYCDELHLSVRERLALFVPVCQAIQHAHQKGVIHRDIKPSNVLVCMQDGRPVPKVIDFGLAKALHQRLSDESIYTEIGAVVGTLEYMSPEQAEMSPLGVDTRTDVYSLGVVFYELLTGFTPLDKQQLRQAAYSEMVRLIKQEVPSKPSTRLTQSQETLANMAALRRTEPARLKKELRGDLDWIAMKALDKDRTRRYEAVSSFARDIERYLHDEPVEACPPSASYRLAKFVRRNKGPVSAATSLLLLLVAGFVGTTWGLVRADRSRREADQAREGETQQRQLAEANEQKAVAAAAAEKQAKETAEAREAETVAVLDFVENKILAAARPEGQEGGLGRAVTLRRAVEAVLPFVQQSFHHQPLIEARLRMTLGRSFWLLGDAKNAADQFRAARTLYTNHRGPDDPDTLRSMHGLALSYYDLGRYDEAVKLNEETLRLRREKLGPDHRDTLKVMSNLANSYHAVGRHAEALKLHEETLKLRQAKLGPDDPDTVSSMHNLAGSYYDLGRYTEALRLNEETLRLLKAKFGPDHPDTLMSMSNLAGSYAAVGRHADALRLGEETLVLYKAKLGAEHPDTLRSMGTLAKIYHDLARYAEALKLQEETLALQTVKLGPDHPDTADTIYSIACIHALSVPKSTDRAKETDRAMQFLQQAVAAGFKDVDQIKKEEDLTALRDRDDFKKLIADLESEKAKEKK
jgi:eukaryotic-like serine/threonine-protein kinase